MQLQKLLSFLQGKQPQFISYNPNDIAGFDDIGRIRVNQSPVFILYSHHNAMYFFADSALPDIFVGK